MKTFCAKYARLSWLFPCSLQLYLFQPPQTSSCSRRSLQVSSIFWLPKAHSDSCSQSLLNCSENLRKSSLVVRKTWLWIACCSSSVTSEQKKPAYADSFDSVHNPINWDFRFLLIFCRLHHMQDMDLLSPGLSLPLDKIRCLSGFLWQEFLCRMWKECRFYEELQKRPCLWQ